MENKKNEIKLFVKFQFTSLSPDAQLISLGIVSDNILSKLKIGEDLPLGGKLQEKTETKRIESTKSFYAEFSDFDINRCDKWVKKNVVEKLKYKDSRPDHKDWFWDKYDSKENLEIASSYLKHWLTQFKDYNITFVCDCGTYDFYWLAQLIGEWETTSIWNNQKNYNEPIKTGLPQLPLNISPVPLDLNDLIAHKKEISVREAFDLDREWLANDYTPDCDVSIVFGSDMVKSRGNKHNALWDAKIIKKIYKKLKNE